ncbi:MAG: hypothetical protein ACC707_01830 [Thiohalomonadales bacterium]
MTKKIPNKWNNEKKSIKAVQVAFDLGEKIQYFIRKEALDLAVNPTDRIRQILKLQVSTRSVRPRLSISLAEADFQILAIKYDLPSDDRVAIKKRAAEELIHYVKNNSVENNSVEMKSVEINSAEKK